MASIVGAGTIQTVWERHPIADVTEQPIHFVRQSTQLIKNVIAIGLEDSKEWHRENYKDFMHGEPWDRALLIQCKQHYEDLKSRFPQMRHYWEDPEATFGEQIVIDGPGWNSENLALGDEIESSSGLKMKITCPRLCCFRVDHRYPAIPTAAHSGAPGTVRHYASAAARAGLFVRILVPGTVGQGDTWKITASPHPSYPLSYLSNLVYGETPINVKFSGTDAQLLELCGIPELCSFEWKDRLLDYKANLLREHPIMQPDTMGHPVPYEEGLKLIVGEWCMLGTAGNAGLHERLAGEGKGYLLQQIGSRVIFRLEGGEVHSDKECLEKRHICGTPRNDRGNFAMEIDLGGFPAFPRYAYMTRIGAADPELFLLLSSGGKWLKIPDNA